MRKNLDIPLTIIVTLKLTVAMLWPLEPAPPAPKVSDELVHLIAFAALAFRLARTGRFGLLPVFIGASAFGGAIKLIQPCFNRSPEFNDWVTDIVVVVLGIGCGLLYSRIRRHKVYFFIRCNLGSFQGFRFSSRLNANQALKALRRCARASPR